VLPGGAVGSQGGRRQGLTGEVDCSREGSECLWRADDAGKERALPCSGNTDPAGLGGFDRHGGDEAIGHGGLKFPASPAAWQRLGHKSRGRDKLQLSRLALSGRIAGTRFCTYSYTYWRPEVPKKLTITVDAEVYDGLHSVVGRRRISRFLNDLARPHVVGQALASGYAAMAADEAREAEAEAWTEGLLGDIARDPDRRER
jgi:hypothetical protein